MIEQNHMMALWPLIRRIQDDQEQRKKEARWRREAGIESEAENGDSSDELPKTDFVRTNSNFAPQSGKVKEVRQIWTRMSEVAKAKDRQLALEKGQQTAQEEMLTKQQKWERFKTNRAVIVDLYIELKKRQLLINDFIKLMEVKKHIRRLHENFNVLLKRRLRRSQAVFAVYKSKIIFRRILRRHRGIREKHK